MYLEVGAVWRAEDNNQQLGDMVNYSATTWHEDAFKNSSLDRMSHVQSRGDIALQCGAGEASARASKGSRRIRKRRQRKIMSNIAFTFLASTLPIVSAQNCIKLSGSTQCPAFNASTVSTSLTSQ